MVTKIVQSKSLESQLGMSLIELMTSSSIGVISLLTIGSVFLSTQEMSMERTKRLFVIQNLNQALRSIKSNAQRAGFNGELGDSYLLSGASSVITTTNTSLSFGYRVNPNSVIPLYTQMTFIQDNEQLDYCQFPVSAAQIIMPCSGALYRIDRGPFSWFDDHRLKLYDFSVQYIHTHSNHHFKFIDVSLTLSIVDGSYQQTIETRILIRNEDK